jgi:hypothetical protein
VIGIVFLYSSCQREAYPIYHLKGEQVQVELPFMRFPSNIALLDSVIVILDLASSEYFYHLCSYPDFVYQYSVGRRGNGPGEIVTPTPFQIYQRSVIMLDGAKGNLFRHTPNSDRVLVAQNFNMPLTVDFVMLNDTTILTGDLNNQNRLALYTPNTRIGLFPIPEKSANSSFDAGLLWRSFMDLNHSKNKLVLATQFGDVIEIYDLNQNNYIQKVGKDGLPRSASQHIKGYCDVKWWDNDIYALYMSNGDFLRKSGIQRAPMGGNIIHVFDEYGNKKKVYHLDMYINGFTIDERRNLIIGITADEDDPVFLFELPDPIVSI